MLVNSIIPVLSKPLFFVFCVVAVGCLIGAVKIKGITLGCAGVLVSALFFGVFFSCFPEIKIGGNVVVLYDDSVKEVYSLLSSIGTAMFIGSVGLTAGPTFFRSFGRNSVTSALIGFIVVSAGAAICVIIVGIDCRVSPSFGVGLMTGGMTSTPGFSSAMESKFANGEVLAAGYGIAYLFGILGKVLFMQMMPKLLRADLEQERLWLIDTKREAIQQEISFGNKIDGTGFGAFALTLVLGNVLGSIKLPIADFSLGTSGGTLVAGILMGHLRHCGKLDLTVPKKTLEFFREAGLILFLVGAGVPGGVSFLTNVRFIYFVYGACITLIPMVVGFMVARFIFRMHILSALASVAGGLTSTPALAALIGVSGTDAVVNVYAAVYPTSLICMIVYSRLLLAIL